jgi:hypothetical protein
MNGTGGGGWVGNGGGNNMRGNNANGGNFTTPGYATAGGGLFDAYDGPNGGGGGSHGYPAITFGSGYQNFYLGQGTTVPGASMGYRGGGGDYFGAIAVGNGGSPVNPTLATQSKAFEPESYFDIVNCSLKGTAGYGSYGYNSGWVMAGNGGPGSGGGAAYSGSPSMYVVGGAGGTGGGGGGVSQDADGRQYGGAGGFGGGGGGVYCAATSSACYGGRGGFGGGGGGASHVSSNNGTLIAGNGGSGCVMVFWKG